ncbi:zinc finger protein 483-like [Antechinus flavipes]|uniref:zinc finger protein 483-like n=1 Tax=Antechinus flavipes TaxID=38775 RepID=UPI00223688FF|nr:zinc finger protein 483-like [Antechinus flavipes]
MCIDDQPKSEENLLSSEKMDLKSMVSILDGKMPALNNKIIMSLSSQHEQNRNVSREQITTLQREKTNSEAFRQNFRGFSYPEKAGPREAVNQLQELCLQWLKPEIHTKDQILELLVLEQFLTILPSEIRIWVKSQHPENIEEAVTLAEDLTQMLEEEALISQDSFLQEKVDDGTEKARLSSVFPVARFQGKKEKGKGKKIGN